MQQNTSFFFSTGASMKKKRRFLFLASALLLTGILAVVFFLWEKTAYPKRLTLYGNIDLRQVDLGFRVFGKLQTMHFEEGDIVHKGELLATLDNTPYQLILRENKAKVNALKENLAYVAAQLERRTQLLEGRSVSDEDYQQAFFQKKAYEANLQEAQAAMKNAQVSMNDAKLFSPSEGVIYTRVREPGTILPVGQPVYSVALNEPVWARAYVSEPDLGKIYPGMLAEVSSDTKESPLYRGHIGYISPIAEFTPKNVESPDLRTSLVYQLRVYIDHPDNKLRQGMPVTVTFPLPEEESK